MNTATRSADLRQILIERRRELLDDVQNRIRGGRIDQSHQVGDDVDKSDAHVQGDIEVALIQMRAETLTRISEALVRLEAGKYGTCLSCGGEITKRRLRALPFAVRCQGCEEKREFAQQDRARHLALTRDEASLFPEVTSWQ
jgi:RNA polymerase-binding transcription factor